MGGRKEDRWRVRVGEVWANMVVGDHNMKEIAVERGLSAEGRKAA